MRILAIDTSGLQAGAAIVDVAENAPYITVGEIFLNARTGEKNWTHSEILMPGVERLFELTRTEPQQVDYVAYTCGPGSFTGLRIGAACVLGIARALDKPAVAVPTLDALAYNMLGTGGQATIVPMLDARRGQVYTAVFSRDDNGKIEKDGSEYMALPVAELLEKLQKFSENTKIIFFGDGADANAETIRDKIPTAFFPPANNNRQRAASVAICAAEKILSGEEISSAVEIMYVRAPQAVREAAAKKSANGGEI
ncbi:MAG: tRNA (adenosine(37)-N6)-threonylcarbamoyltransferase complex dimerization subunit type 1 TsaB [Defluviitaleaceae bacterium]|nr:tRNA (adenosine(37)-N6)-threonylcarbamoyltransferase complex dimerization subunit type 1 TsaB [Defluviitaleaceae bacterium]MCL2263725.1 tRNA (adenosine(37)-N6)-threonylcarbamoyltransferase complex dimerization subunit type 1 TsaB [Defluviitaleaceae bacterium]